MSNVAQDEQPKQIGRYQIVRQLGRGGMAVVYLGLDPRIKREVAVKVLPRQFSFYPDFRQRFQQEVEIIARLEHPAIVPVYDFGEDDDLPYIVMRYMPGGSLRQQMQGKAFPLQEVNNLLARLAPALDKAHQQGVIHRDLKPDNILFDADHLPYLSDFGIARVAEATHTMTIIGTPAYMSPEQWETGKVDSRSDLYALGVVLFELLTGRPPYSGDTPANLMRQHLLEPVPDPVAYNRQLTPACQFILQRALEKKPDRRFPTAAHLLLALQQAADDPVASVLIASQDTLVEDGVEPEPETPYVATEVVPPSQKVHSRRLPAWSWSLLLIPLLALGAWGLFGRSNNQASVTATPDDSQVVVALTETPTNTPSSTPLSVTPTTTLRNVDTPSPTATASATATQATPTETPPPEPLIRLILPSVNVRAGPGEVYPVRWVLLEDDTFEVAARTADGNWYLIEMEGEKMGWIAASVAEVMTDPAAIEIALTIPPRPTNTPTNTPVPPTHTPVPPTSIPIPSTDTPRPTDTPDPTITPDPYPPTDR